MARDQLAMMSQIQHLTSSLAKSREQILAQADFAVDAIQQVRDEVAGAHVDGATHAAGAIAPKQLLLQTRKLGNHISRMHVLDLIRSCALIATVTCLKSLLSSAKTVKHTSIRHAHRDHPEFEAASYAVQRDFNLSQASSPPALGQNLRSNNLTAVLAESTPHFQRAFHIHRNEMLPNLRHCDDRIIMSTRNIYTTGGETPQPS